MLRLVLPLFTSILFAGSFIAAKQATFELGPLTTSLFRYTISLLFLTSLLPFQGLEKLKIVKSDIYKFVLLGLTGIVGFQYFFFVALRYTEVANTSIITALIPVVTGLLAAWFIRERLNLWNYLGIGLSVTGVLILLSKGSIANLLSLDFAFGDLLMIISVFMWSIYVLIVKTLTAKYHAYTITWYATLFGVLILLILVWFEQPFQTLNELSLTTVVAIIYMGIVASGLAYLLYNLSIEKIGPTLTAGIVYSIVPILVAIFSWIFFLQAISYIMIISTTIILAGLWLMLKQDRVKPK
jgi:drug/metabolite transporter (DMT)-like permease